MPDQPMSSPTREAEAATDALILDLLVKGSSTLWTVDELAREHGHELDTKDAVARLAGAGLAHRCDRYVFPSRAGVRAHRLAETGAI